MSIITSSIRNSNGTSYTITTDSSSDWSSVAVGTYFKDLSDGLIRYKMSNGDIQSVITFPYTGSALITGSLGVTGSVSILAYTASADKVFYIRNSANTYDIISNYGSELTIIGRNESSEPRLLINRAGSTKMLLGGTTDLNITFPSSGKGEINSGAQGLDIIATSGDIRTRNASTYTLLKGNFFGIGQATPAARLDVLAQGALSTDIAFRVRNSADTADIISVQGNNTIVLTQYPKIDTTSGTFIQTNAFDSLFVGRGNSTISNYSNTVFGTSNTLSNSVDNYNVFGAYNNVAGMRNIAIGNSNKTSGDASIRIGVSTGQDTFGGNYSMHFGRAGGGGFITYSANEVTNFFFNDYRTSQMFRGNGSILLSGKNSQITTDANVTTFMGDGGNTLVIRNHASIPSTNVADSFQQYSADIVAGNASPHFRTEAGNIVKLYTQAAVTSSQGIADALTNLGFLTGSSTIASTNPFPFTGSAVITGSLTITGSVQGNINVISIVSSTASMNLSLGNFFELTLASSTTTYLEPTNIQPGQTINLKINQPATSGSLTYGPKFKFPGGIPYSASSTGSVTDIVSLISFDSTTLYTTAIKNLS